MTTDQPAPLLDLLATLDLEELGSAQVSVQPLSTAGALAGEAPVPLPETFAEDITLFRGQSQKQPHGRVFGGQVLAQGVVACGRTVRAVEGRRDRRLHSLHAYFMRPGDDTQPITFSVERMRDGRSFSTRRVHAIQHGKPILSMSASFQDPGPRPGPPGPDAGRPRPDVRAVAGRRVRRGRPPRRPAHRPGAGHRPAPRRGQPVRRPGHRARWPTSGCGCGPSASCPTTRSCTRPCSAYASDYSLLESILRRHGRTWRTPGLRAASLDHAMWFHRPARADEWMLYAEHSPSAQGGRGLGIGRMFTEDGVLVATVAQEGMLRLPE